MEKIIKSYASETKALSDRQIEFRLSTARRDRHGDTVAVNGWDTKNYLRNPVVLYGHNYDAMPIGRCTSLYKSGDALIATAQFATPDLNPFGDNVYRMLKAGFLNAVSVGFLPKAYDDTKDGRNFTSQELLEFSVVPVPANSDALAISRSLMSGSKSASRVSKTFDVDAYDILMAIDKEIARRAELARAKRNGEIVFRF